MLWQLAEKKIRVEGANTKRREEHRIITARTQICIKDTPRRGGQERTPAFTKEHVWSSWTRKEKGQWRGTHSLLQERVKRGGVRLGAPFRRKKDKSIQKKKGGGYGKPRGKICPWKWQRFWKTGSNASAGGPEKIGG